MISDADRLNHRAALRAGTARSPLAEYLSSLALVPVAGTAPGAHPAVQRHNFLMKDGGSPGLLLDCRALSAGLGAAGGVFVGESADPAADALRPLSVVLRAGAQLVEAGHGGNLVLPSLLTGHVLQWLPEGQAPAAPSEPVFGGVASVPRRCSGWFDLSKQLITQSPQVAVAALLRDVRSAIAQALDRAALQGTGTLAEPAGILNTPGTGSFTFGGAATGADFMAAERTLASPACRETWRGLPQSATLTSVPLWTETDHVAGLPAYVGGNLPGNRVVIGSFVEVEILVWSLELLANPFSRSLEHQVRMVTNVLAGVRVRRPAGFMVSTDSGAQ